ncbi:gustatory receptor 137 [Tribolium castaneum]|uniref:Gustatory receptor n=1 Tax=Tribolium castaneum TaxID=7070 RepID=D6WP96_TRICA|nr:gustatory receptor 137 [Tribolium castaneum]
MSVFTETPLYLKLIYKLTGVYHNSGKNNFFSVVTSIVWCLPFYSYFIYLCIDFNLLSHTSSDVFVYIEFCSNLSTIMFTTISFFVFNVRRNRIRALLKKVKNLRLGVISRSTKPNWPRMALIGSIVVNTALIPFKKCAKINYTIYTWFPALISTSEVMYLNVVLNYFNEKFDSINHNLQNLLITSFLLTQSDKLKSYEEDDTNYEIQHIQDLSLVHYKLVQQVSEFSDIFGITIILSLILWFENIIETFYFLIYMMVNGSDSLIYESAVYGCYVVFAISWMFILIFSFSTVQNKANATVIYVHDIGNKYLLSGKMNVKTQHLSFISARLLSMKLQFTALHFFNLDWTFCHMLVAAVATYVVILVQFRI